MPILTPEDDIASGEDEEMESDRKQQKTQHRDKKQKRKAGRATSSTAIQPMTPPRNSSSNKDAQQTKLRSFFVASPRLKPLPPINTNNAAAMSPSAISTASPASPFLRLVLALISLTRHGSSRLHITVIVHVSAQSAAGACSPSGRPSETAEG